MHVPIKMDNCFFSSRLSIIISIPFSHLCSYLNKIVQLALNNQATMFLNYLDAKIKTNFEMHTRLPTLGTSYILLVAKSDW